MAEPVARGVAAGAVGAESALAVFVRTASFTEVAQILRASPRGIAGAATAASAIGFVAQSGVEGALHRAEGAGAVFFRAEHRRHALLILFAMKSSPRIC